MKVAVTACMDGDHILKIFGFVNRRKNRQINDDDISFRPTYLFSTTLQRLYNYIDITEFVSVIKGQKIGFVGFSLPFCHAVLPTLGRTFRLYNLQKLPLKKL
jgi:hypothetical protein